MPGSISNFLSTFRNDLARPNRFDVNIPIPLGLIQYIKTSTPLQYRCDATNLPGRTIATTEQKTYGPIEKYPYLSTYNDIDLTFIVSGDMTEKIFFDAWLNYVNPTQSNNFRYKTDYAVTLSINQYDQSNNLSYTVALFDAYPISVNQLDLDWSNDSYHKLSVTFAYTYWKNNSIQGFAQDLVDQALNSVFSSLSSIDLTSVQTSPTAPTDTNIDPNADNYNKDSEGNPDIGSTGTY
jgi:hypothetical protein